MKNEYETEDLRTSAFILKGDICYSISLNEMITMEGAYAGGFMSDNDILLHRPAQGCG